MLGIKLKHLLLALLPLALAGCISDEEQRVMDQDKCASYGYRPGTNGFADCLMSQDEQRAEAEQRSLDRMRAQEQRDRDRKREKAHRRSNSDIDPRPSFDKDGNPNFDTEGNYQGCHGIGCEVDDPDDD